jgi:hypothetical protein
MCAMFMLFPAIELKTCDPLVVLTVWLLGAIYVQQQQIEIIEQNYYDVEQESFIAATNTQEDLQTYTEIKKLLHKDRKSYHNLYPYESKRHIIEHMKCQPKNLKNLNLHLNNASHFKYNKSHR